MSEKKLSHDDKTPSLMPDLDYLYPRVPEPMRTRLREQTIETNHRLFRLVAVVAGLAGVSFAMVIILATGDGQSDVERAVRAWALLSFSVLSFLLALYLLRRPPGFLTRNVLFESYAFVFYAMTTVLTIFDLAGPYTDYSSFLIGTLGSGLILSAPIRVYAIGTGGSLTVIVAYLTIASPGSLMPNEIVMLCLYGLMSVFLAIILELRRRQSAWLRLRLTDLNHELQNLSFSDPLTGIHNRRFFTEVLSRNLAMVRRGQQDFVLVVIDVDHFKRVNDLHGHNVGDEVLKTIAQRLSYTLRDTDIIARYGGEEFVILLPGIGIDPARHVAERIRNSVSETALPELSWAMTISIGLTQAIANDSVETVFKRADQALYQAKQEGRNRVVSV